MKRRFFLILIVIMVLFLPIIPRFYKKPSPIMMVEWLTEQEKAARGDTNYGYERIIHGDFNEKWIELYQPVDLLFRAFRAPFETSFRCGETKTVVTIGTFMEHDFIDKIDQYKISEDAKCYGIKIKKLENVGWMWKRQVYYECYGLKFAKYCLY